MGALKDVIANGVALPALLRAGRWKGANAVQGYPDIGAPWFALADPCQKTYAKQAVPDANAPSRPACFARVKFIIGRNRRQAMSDACAVVSRGKSKSIPRWCHHRPLRLTAALVATSTDPGSRSPIPIRKSMQTGQFQTPPAVRAWCAWTLALALAASAFGTPAQAQTSVALVSNQGQTNQASRNSPHP